MNKSTVVDNKTGPMDMKYLRICMLHTSGRGHVDVFSPEDDKMTVTALFWTDLMKLKSHVCFISVNTTTTQALSLAAGLSIDYSRKG